MKKVKKMRVGVIMGGKSGEHDVSLISASSVINALDKNKYEVVPIGITKNGQWISGPDAVKVLKSEVKSKLMERILLPDPNQKSLVSLKQRQKSTKPLDVIIPVLHGTYGEDGKIQGLLELVDIPYVGSGVLGSAVGMDKIIMKKLFIEAGLKTSQFTYFSNYEWKKNRSKEIKSAEKLKYPLFVKPANSGSSVGISKVKNKKELVVAVNEALRFDRRIIVEKSIENCRELECSVLGNNEPVASGIGEIRPTSEFYSYQAKYIAKDDAVLEVPARLPQKISKKIQTMAATAFKELDLAGLARVDFLLGPKGDVFINEVNTMPGFTSISMYPKLWEHSGIPYKKLLDKLISLALARRREKSALRTDYNLKPKL